MTVESESLLGGGLGGARMSLRAARSNGRIVKREEVVILGRHGTEGSI